MDQWLRSVIRQVIHKRDMQKEKRHDFLQFVLDKREKHGTIEYNENTIIGHSLSFLADGYETSSIAMSYCLYEVYVLIIHFVFYIDYIFLKYYVLSWQLTPVFKIKFMKKLMKLSKIVMVFSLTKQYTS